MRYYGWMNSSNRTDRDEVRWLACAAMGLLFLLWIGRPAEPPQLPPALCIKCGGSLRMIQITYVNCRVLVDCTDVGFDRVFPRTENE